jgi:hypothetical protein
MVFTAPADGSYPIVVFRTLGTDADDSVDYDLVWSDDASMYVAETAAPARLELAGAYPNPVSAATQIMFSLPHAGVVALDVLDLASRKIPDAGQRQPGGRDPARHVGRMRRARPAGAGGHLLGPARDRSASLRKKVVVAR